MVDQSTPVVIMSPPTPRTKPLDDVVVPLRGVPWVGITGRVETLVTMPRPTTAVATTCAYCGVGCQLKAEVADETVVRMVPNRAGQANQGHA